MKNFIIFFGLVIASMNLHAKEVQLLCKGEVTYLGEKPTPRIYEVEFDDQKNVVLSMTAELSQGCTLEKNDEISRTRSCNCKVTQKEISCESIAEGKKFLSHLHQDTFTVNRRTGRMTTSYSFTGKNDNGTEFGFFRKGELTCERFMSNKF